MLNRYTNATSYNTFRRHVNALINEAVNLGMDERDLLKNKSKKAKAKLHKPFRDIGLILDEIKAFNSNLSPVLSSDIRMPPQATSRNKGVMLGGLL